MTPIEVKPTPIQFIDLPRSLKRLVLCYAKGYSQKEIAEKLGISLNTVRSYHSHLLDSVYGIENIDSSFKIGVYIASHPNLRKELEIAIKEKI